MPETFDDTFIDRVRHAADIAGVIGDYVTLKQRGGGDKWGLCPFHNEKTPSFHVHSDRGIYKCFGCGRGGNVFTFLMEIEGVSFVESVKMTAERYGIEVPKMDFSPEAQKAKNEREKISAAMQYALTYYHKSLLGEFKDKNLSYEADPNLQNSMPKSISPNASKALTYLLERGINYEIIQKFQIGWAEAGWDNLTKEATGYGFEGETLVQAGLAHPKKDGSGYVDRFRARIIFPILNLSGKPVAFGARRIEGITPEDDEAKYVNSPETVVYNKGEQLYGLYNSRQSIRKKKFAFLVEGYTDLLALAQAGLDNAVASLGTSLTAAQARLIKRFAPRVHIVYDSDTAGIDAALRAADIFIANGLEARIIKLPEGEDPDSLLKKSGAGELQETLGKDVSFIEFRYRTAGELLETGSQSDKVSGVRKILETLKTVPDPLRRELLLQELTIVSGLSRSSIDSAFASIRLRQTDRSQPSERVQLKFTEETVAERDIMKSFLSHPELIAEYMDSLSPSHFLNPEMKDLFLLFEKAFIANETIDMKSLPEKFDNPAMRAFIAEADYLGNETTIDRTREAVEECLVKMRKRDFDKKTKELELKINEAAKLKQPTKDLLRELVRMRREFEREEEVEFEE